MRALIIAGLFALSACSGGVTHDACPAGQILGPNGHCLDHDGTDQNGGGDVGPSPDAAPAAPSLLRR